MRIALIAMSGIRVRDEELLRLGLTLPGFVERSRQIASLPSLGLLTLAGMTPPRHEITYIEIPDLRAAEIPAGFDLAAISSYSAQIDEAYALARRLRQAGVPVVLGGLHVTALPDEALRHADAVVVGEGETVWPQILDDAGRGRLRGRYGDGRGAFDLARSPMPAYELLDVKRYNRLTVQTSRGCPHCCSFCASSVLLSPRYKQKPAEKVLAEIDRIRKLWPRPFLELADDNSLIDRAYWKDLLPRLARRRLRWFTETDLSAGDDEELLERLRASGCAQILVGLESPREADLRGLERRGDWKRRQWPRYVESIRRIQSHGIAVNGCFVLGLDGQGPDVFDEVREFVESSGLYEVQVTILTPFPGTPLHAELKAADRLLRDGDWGRCTLFDVNYVPDGMSVDQLETGFRRLVADLYTDAAIRRRRSRFRRQLRQLARAGRRVPA